MYKNVLILFLSINIKLLVESKSNCDLATNCNDCIMYDENCVWCSEPNMTERRCVPKTFYDSDTTWCKGNPYYPKEDFKLPKSDALSSNTSYQVQITPQEAAVRLRPGNSAQIQLKFKPAEDYPLDVYYLLDSTITMVDYIQQLQRDSESLFKNLTDTTNNVFFGLGTFAEKPALPYSSFNKGNINSYRNYLNLTNDTTAFQEALNQKMNGANLDVPEASLDALMQVMVCEKELHWRPKARRVIVLLTDAPFHTAGDGKMLGIIKPNDRKCHLENNINKMELELDYPSISQINKEASDRAFTVIMAVQNTKDFESFAARISGSKLVELRVNKSNIVDTIIKEYTKLLETVQFQSKVLQPHIEVKLNPECSSSNPCKMGFKETLEINATITVTSCPSAKDLSNLVTIGPVGLSDELQINVTALCECDCAKKVEKNSTSCNNHGDYLCGICKCNDNWHGDTCQNTGETSDSENANKCKVYEDDKLLCNGRGICVQGKCKCNNEYYGDYCEYHDKFCPQPGNKICSGHGKCVRNKCDCDRNQWVGDDCRCPKHNNDCIASYSSQVCSGNGECICGKCRCTKSKGNKTYSGYFCEECYDCYEKRCVELEDYAECNYFNEEALCEEKFNQTSEVIEVKKVNISNINDLQWQTAHRCRKTLKDGSGIIFKYMGTSTKKLIIILQNEKEDAPKPDIMWAIGSVIGAVVLVGLLTGIIWRTLLYIYDVREYNNFSKMAAAEGYDVATDNPLYKDPQAEFINPTYSRCSN